MTTMQCPCCGSKVDRKTPIVDLNTNSISFNGVLRLTPMQAEIASVLSDQFGRFVGHDRLLSRVYGLGSEPENPRNVISTQICHMSPKLARVGLRIEGRKNIGGRRMVAL